MKKIFASMLALVALSVAFTSCGGDSKDEPSTSKSCTFCFNLTDDVFKLYDVTLTKTVGTTESQISFSQSTTVDSKSAKSTGTIQISASSSETLKLTATVTLKSNWQEILNTMDRADVYLKYEMKTSTKSSNELVGSGKETSKWTQAALENYAKLFANGMSVSL